LEVVKALVRFLSYIFHGLLCLILLAMSVVAMVAGSQSLNLQMLPASLAGSVKLLFLCALFGLVTVILAIRGSLRPLFFLWSLVVVVLLVKGYLLGGYHFVPGEFQRVLYLIAGSLIALLGSWLSMTRELFPRRS
jgi:hypothetical protein